MAVFSNIQRALDTKLNSLTSAPPIAWPNTKYTPTQDTTFIRPTLMPADSSLKTLTDQKSNPGIYQIDIFTPLEKGAGTALSWADNIKSHFEADRRLVAGSDTIWIKEISLGRGERQDAWFRLYVTITYECLS